MPLYFFILTYLFFLRKAASQTMNSSSCSGVQVRDVNHSGLSQSISSGLIPITSHIFSRTIFEFSLSINLFIFFGQDKAYVPAVVAVFVFGENDACKFAVSDPADIYKPQEVFVKAVICDSWIFDLFDIGTDKNLFFFLIFHRNIILEICGKLKA